MQKFNKSKIFLYFNLIFAIIFIFASFLCFININKTNVHLGIDLFLIFGWIFLVFASPFIFNFIRYLLLPDVLITISKDAFTIHKRNKDINLYASKLLGVSKVNNLWSVMGINIGTLKILLRDVEIPIYIRFLDDFENAYQTLNVLIIKNYEYLNRNKTIRY